MSLNAHPTGLQQWSGTVDPVVAYAEWRMSCTAVWAAYHRWLNVPRAEEDLAHAAYLEALDREEAAARAYSSLHATTETR